MLGIGVAIFLGALIAVAVIALIVLLGVWTYRDAQNKGMNGILWTAIVFLVPSCIGLIIYLIVRMDNHRVTCSNCNQTVNGKEKYCSNCGMELVPVVDMSEDTEGFKKSQRKILIGFFSTLAAIVVMAIFMVASIIAGSLKLAGDAVQWFSKLDTTHWVDSWENTLGDIDALLNEGTIHISAGDGEVSITDQDGRSLIYIGNDHSVDVNLDGIKQILDENGIEYDEDIDEEELEEEIRQEIEDAIKEAVKDAVSDHDDHHD